MDRKKLRKMVVELYGFFIEEALQRSTKYKLKSQDKAIIDGFINYYKNKHIGVEFLCEYFEAQFNYWLWMRDNKKLQVSMNYLQISWIVGKKAITRYEEKLKKTAIGKFKDIRSKMGVYALEKFREKSDEDKIGYYKKVNQTEEREKNRYLNTDLGLQWCIEHTFLYNEMSDVCKACKFSKQCKSILKQNYSVIYTIRNQ